MKTWAPIQPAYRNWRAQACNRIPETALCQTWSDLDMDSKTAAPLVSALSIVAATALGIGCDVATAAAEPDVRPMLNAAPSISFVYYTAPGMFLQTPTGVA